MVLYLFLSATLFLTTLLLLLIWLKLIETLCVSWFLILFPWFLWDILFVIYVYIYQRTRTRTAWLWVVSTGYAVWTFFKLALVLSIGSRSTFGDASFAIAILWTLITCIVTIRYSVTDPRVRKMVMAFGRKYKTDLEDAHHFETVLLPMRNRNGLHHRKNHTDDLV